MRSILSLILACASVASAAPGYVFSNAPGPHPVGLRIVRQYDYTRAYQSAVDLYTGQPRTGEPARPVQTLLWYPARKNGEATSYADYVRTVATEDDFERTSADATRLVEAYVAGRGKGLSVAQRLEELRAPMWARRNATPEAGPFPLIIYAPSHSATAFENVDLCEYLASQGYVVLASASVGAHGRAMDSNLEGAESQAADIAFLVGYAHGLPQVDLAHIGVVGFSWGGLSNVLAAAKDRRIRALVSLDGSMRGYPEYINGGKDAAKYATPARVAVPLLYVSAEPKSIEEMSGHYDLSFSFINAMRYSDVYYLTMHPMVHGNFSTEGLRFEGDDAFGEYSRAEVMQAHGWASRYVLAFLDAYLKQDSASLAYVRTAPVKHGAPAHMGTLEVRPAQGDVPTLESFSLALHAKGFEQATAIYQSFQQREASFSVAEGLLIGWAYKLLRAGTTSDAVALFELAVHVYPDSWNAHDSLAEGYAANHDRAMAIKHYQRSLELNPRNDNAERQLKALAAPDPPG